MLIPEFNYSLIGPSWSKYEIRMFFDELQNSGKDWQAIAERLGNGRNSSMARALHARHRSYLDSAYPEVETFVEEVD